MLKLGHQAWKELPVGKKEVYMQSYKEECSKIMKSGSSPTKDSGVKLPKVPYQWVTPRSLVQILATAAGHRGDSFVAP
ncbi:hypothetical protein E2C01_089202 [Portunus trituberculatus]|uniref:Uncharacterized protein n=1 Tax=Portunus trituberculatus TaxID=210409 RepID=A0A5B7J859_PORTR|nr:hypothetical protein [Portunus trituberculatus]